jgi:hypothetical protein
MGRHAWFLWGISCLYVRGSTTCVGAMIETVSGRQHASDWVVNVAQHPSFTTCCSGCSSPSICTSARHELRPRSCQTANVLAICRQAATCVDGSARHECAAASLCRQRGVMHAWESPRCCTRSVCSTLCPCLVAPGARPSSRAPALRMWQLCKVAAAWSVHGQCTASAVLNCVLLSAAATHSAF